MGGWVMEGVTEWVVEWVCDASELDTTDLN